MDRLTFFDFCSGIGGGRLGLELCGYKCIGFADTSRLAVKTYRCIHNTDSENNFGDIKKIKHEQLPLFDIFIAGFPCQTFSVIGSRTGFDDKRGQLIFHLIELMDTCRPKAVILENVRGLVSHDKGRTLETIIGVINSIGYDVVHKVISSLNYGVPQMRQRIFLVCFRKESNLVRKFIWPSERPIPPLSDFLISEDNELTKDELSVFSYYLNNKTNRGIYKPEELCDKEYLVIDTRMSDLRQYTGKVPTLRSQRDGILYVKNGILRRLTGYEALLLQGFPKELAEKANMHISDRHLLMQAGSAMTVNVIASIGNSIDRVLRS